MEESGRLDLKDRGCLQGKKLEKYRARLLEGFEPLSLVELRRYRQPHHICVVKELEEAGYLESVEFIQELIVENEEVIAADDWEITPKLTESPKFMDVLREIVTKAEEARKNKNPIAESKEFSIGASRIISMALGLGPESEGARPEPGKGRGWLWLVRRLLLVSLGLAQQIQIDGGQREAETRYLYARFLLTHYPEHDTDTAADHLVIARKMSLGMTKWRFGEEEGDSNETLLSHICLLMRDMYLKKFHELKNNDISAAFRSVQLAVKRAKEAEKKIKYAEAVTQRGHCYILLFKFDTALGDFSEVLGIQKDLSNFEGICEALINVALALQKVRKIDESKEYLDQIMSLALAHGLNKWQAHAFWRLGELMLRGNRPKEGSQLLFKAFGCFGSGGSSKPGNALTSESKMSFNNVAKYEYVSRPRSYTITGTRKENLRMNTTDIRDKILYAKEVPGFLVSTRPKKDEIVKMQYPMTSVIQSHLVHSDQEVFGRRSTVGTLTGSVTAMTKKARKAMKKRGIVSTYFLDDNLDEDNTVMTPTQAMHKNELNILRCMYGISRAHELMDVYFRELGKANTSMNARLKIINWKLHKDPFWEEEVKRKATENTMEITSIPELESDIMLSNIDLSSRDSDVLVSEEPTEVIDLRSIEE